MITALCISVGLNVLFLGWLLYGLFFDNDVVEDPYADPGERSKACTAGPEVLSVYTGGLFARQPVGGKCLHTQALTVRNA